MQTRQQVEKHYNGQNKDLRNDSLHQQIYLRLNNGTERDIPTIQFSLIIS